MEAVYDWFGRNGLALNPAKTEALIVGTSVHLRHEAPVASVSMAGADIKIAESVKSLGVTIDSSLISTSTSTVYAAHLDTTYELFDISVDSLTMIPRGPSPVLWSEPALTIATVSSMVFLNATSISFNVSRTRWLTQWLARLHWLPIKDRIQYKIALLTHKVLTTNQPEYLADLIHYYQPRRQLRSASHRQFTA